SAVGLEASPAGVPERRWGSAPPPPRDPAVASGCKKDRREYMNRSRFRTLPLFGAMAVALLLPTGAIAADSYLCYQAKSSKNPAQTKFVGVEINAKDQFQPGGRNYLASKFTELCNPTTGAANPTIHQVELAVKDSKVNLNPSKFVKPTTTYNLTDAYVTN